MAARIDRPGAVILVALLCLPSLTAAIPGGETAESPPNGTNATVGGTATAVETTGIADTVTASDATTRTAQDTDPLPETTTVTETIATGTVTDSVDDTTDETAETVENTSKTTRTPSMDAFDVRGDSVETDVDDTNGTDAVDPSLDSGQSAGGASDGPTDPSAATPTENRSVDATNDSTGALGDATTAPESEGDGGARTTAASTADATTAITGTVDAVAGTVADADDAETASARIGSDGAARTVSGEATTVNGENDGGGDEETAEKHGSEGDGPETATTDAASAAADNERMADGIERRPPPDDPVPTPADTANLAGAVFAVGLASHLPDVAALTVNGGGTTGVAPVAERGGGRFLRFVAPLRYSRYDDSDPLEHEVRADLFERIERAPGTYLSELDDGMDVSLSTVRHHLRVLEREGLVTGAKVRGKRRFYPDGEGVHALAAALADGPTAAVLDAVARGEPASVGELADELERDPSTVTHHLKRLEKDGLVERERDGRAVVSRLSPEAKTAFSGRNAVSAGD